MRTASETLTSISLCEGWLPQSSASCCCLSVCPTPYLKALHHCWVSLCDADAFGLSGVSSYLQVLARHLFHIVCIPVVILHHKSFTLCLSASVFELQQTNFLVFRNCTVCVLLNFHSFSRQVKELEISVINHC